MALDLGRRGTASALNLKEGLGLVWIWTSLDENLVLTPGSDGCGPGSDGCRYLRTAMRELVNLCFSLEEESLCLRESFFRGLLRSNALLCHWLLSTCCSRRPTHTSKEINRGISQQRNRNDHGGSTSRGQLSKASKPRTKTK